MRVSKESAKEELREVEGETRESKEPRESKKKKWEKIEVNFQYDSPQNRRGRGGKFNRNTRGGGRDSVARGKDGTAEKDEKPRIAPRSDGEDTVVHTARESIPVERRAQSLSFDPGHRQQDGPSPEWQMRPQYTQEPLSGDSERWRTSSPSRSERPSQANHDVSAQRSRSRGSSREKNSSPNGSKQATEQQHSPATSPNGASQFPDLPSQWDEQDSNIGLQNNPQFGQQANHARRGNSRGYRGRNGYSPNAYSQGQYIPPPLPQQVPFQGFFPPLYPPMQTGFPVNGRAHSVPYYQSNTMSRYPQPGYPPQFYPDYSRLGVQPVPVPLIDEEIKQRIIRQVYGSHS